MARIHEFIIRTWKAGDPLNELQSISKRVSFDVCETGLANRMGTRMAEALTMTGVSRDAFTPLDLSPDEHKVVLEVHEIIGDERVVHNQYELPDIKAIGG